jgi:4a-hydroxytetrahydrobiopterin dehydratase
LQLNGGIISWLVSNFKLTKIIVFDNEAQLNEFLLKLSKHADEIDHHPEIHIINCCKLKIELFTHDKNQITELDYAMAKYIDNM